MTSFTWGRLTDSLVDRRVMAMPHSTSNRTASPEAPLFSADDLSELRQALALDLRRDDGWTDDELQAMAANTLHFFSILRRIAAAQQRRQP